MNQKFIDQLHSIVLTNISDENFGVRKLSELLGLSPSQTLRKTKAASGKSVNQYIRELRLEKGSELLKETDKSIAEISYQVGFSSASYFNKTFRKYYEVTSQRAPMARSIPKLPQLEKDIFGEDYYYWKLYQSSEQLKYLSEEGKGEALNDPKASSITFYDKGGLALHILREIVGDEVFKEGVKNYLVKNQFQNVSIKDFLHEIEFIYGKSLSNFDRDWIKQTKFPYEEVYQSLMKSNFMRDYFNVLSLRPLSMSSKILDFDKILDSSNYFLSQEVVFQLQNEPISSTLPIYKKAFKTNDINIRQAIALSMNKIPSELKTDYESLLDDKSYATQEIAFGNLCANFYLDRTKYLDKMDTVIGFRDKNIRQFWLFMALITEDYNPKKKDTYINELKKYSSSNYGYTVREKAFEYLGYLSLWDSGTLNNLIDACQHHYWRFRNFSRKLLMELWKNDIYKKQLILLSDTLDNQAHFFLNKILKEN